MDNFQRQGRNLLGGSNFKSIFNQIFLGQTRGRNQNSDTKMILKMILIQK